MAKWVQRWWYLVLTLIVSQLETVEEIQELIDEACDVMLESSVPRSRAYALNQ
jgi:hypothetical protein